MTRAEMIKVGKKRRRAPTDPLDVANKKTDDKFITDYLTST